MSVDPEKQPTTFGAIIERKSPPTPTTLPRGTSPMSAPSGLPKAGESKPAGTTPQTLAPTPHRPPPLHSVLSDRPLSTVEQPLPSPYSATDSLNLGHNDEKKSSPPRIPSPAAHVGTVVPHSLATPNSKKVSSEVCSADVKLDLEAQLEHSPSSAQSSTKSAAVTATECNVWPSQQQLKTRAKKGKAARSCNPMLRLSKRNRFIVSVVIALTIIGAAVGIGVGVSRATNGEVWAGRGKTRPISPTMVR